MEKKNTLSFDEMMNMAASIEATIGRTVLHEPEPRMMNRSQAKELENKLRNLANWISEERF